MQMCAAERREHVCDGKRIEEGRGLTEGVQRDYSGSEGVQSQGYRA